MSLKTSTMEIPGAAVGGCDPLPRFRRQTGFGVYTIKAGFPEEAKKDLGSCVRTLPYRLQNRYGRDRKMMTLKTAVLENRYLKAVFTPQYGGRLWSLYDKENKRDVLMSNPVLQPANLAIRDAWISGGIEWNFGSVGHTYFNCDDVWAAAIAYPDDTDEKFLRVYGFERAKECFFQMDFHLPQDSRRLFVHVRITNPGDDTTTYWWTNVAVPDDGGVRVLSSSENVIFPSGGQLSYEKLPHLSVMEGDLSYPSNVTRSFDYFFQPEDGVKTTWEAGVDKKGFAYYDRSTAPLLYHKMFCWGNHRAGARWQEYLSDGDKGRYIELQAGLARSQMHDVPFPAHSSYEWTQCFGGTYVDPGMVHGLTLHEANARFGLLVQELIPENELLRANERYVQLADLPVREEDIIHSASGWGALHLKLCRDVQTPLCFPENSLGEEQAPWIYLLENGIMPEADPDAIPPSWMVSDKWAKLLKDSLNRPGGRTWISELHYGNMMFEHWDNAHTVPTARLFDASEYEKAAEEAWLDSDRLTPNVWAERNLALLYRLRGDKEKADAYYNGLFRLPASLCDPAFAAEYMSWLNADGEYGRSWELFEKLPEALRKYDRITLHAARCAVKLEKFGFLDGIFDREYSAI
ncbi:MAG: DUF5107 domain-containing protein, partial [Clostridia bacterium]|nr:DUF5107 domain-containing protein [Clostridia bacterium]